MTQQEIKKALIKAVQQFEDEYPEWSVYTLSLKPDTATVEIVSDADDNGEVKELLRDFLGALKDNNLMVVNEQANKIVVDEYVYIVEDGLDDLADELEAKYGKQITNLKIQEKDGQPYVRFRYIGNMTTDEKDKIKQGIIDIASQYQAIDEDDAFADVEFDDFDDIMDEIKKEDMVEDLEELPELVEETKAEDSIYAPGIYWHGSPEFKSLPRALQDLLRIDYKTNARIYEKVPYSDIVEGDWKHDRDERLAFINQYKDSHVIVDIDTGEDYVILLALSPSYIESFEQNKAEDIEIDEESEETYFVIVDNDAPVEYTRAELLASVSEEDFEKLLAGETISYTNDKGEEFQVSLVLNDIVDDSDESDDALYIPHADKMISKADIDEAADYYDPKLLYKMQQDLKKGLRELKKESADNYEEDEYDFFLALYEKYIQYVEDKIKHIENNEESENKAEDMITDLFAKDQMEEMLKLPVNQKQIS